MNWARGDPLDSLIAITHEKVEIFLEDIVGISVRVYEDGWLVGK